MRHLLSASSPLLLALCSLLNTSQAGAETLLAQIVIQGHKFDPSAEVIPVGMNFGVFTPGVYAEGFFGDYTTADVGSIFEASVSVVDQVDAAFNNQQSEISGTTIDGQWGPFSVTQFWSLPTWITPHVPQLGIGLEGYDVSRMTRRVDSIIWTDFGDYFVVDGQQTIRLYGHVEVPEPATPVLIAALMVICVTRHCRPSALRSRLPALVALCPLLTTSTATAQTLLVSFVFPGHQQAGSIQPVPMTFSVDTVAKPFTTIGNFYTVEDVGSIYEGPPSNVADIAMNLGAPDGSIAGVTLAEAYVWNVDRIWNTPQYITPYVPRIGFGLKGYTVERITQTVDSLIWTPRGGASGGWIGTAQQTIRLYGHVVPEPCANALLFLAGVHLVTLARCQRD